MKHLLIIGALAVGLCSVARAQETAPDSTPSKEEKSDKLPATKLEAFLARKGSLLIRDDFGAGKIDKAEDFSFVSVGAVAVYAPGQEKLKAKGLRVSGYRARGRGLSDDGTAFLDVEEAQELSRAIQYLVDLEPKWAAAPPAERVERQAYFKTKGDFRIGFSIYNGATRRLVQLGSFRPFGMEIGSTDQMLQFKTIIDGALSWLEKQ